MKNTAKNLACLTAIVLLAVCCGCGSGSDGSSNRTTYRLDANASGVLETLNSIANLTVVSKDANDLTAEYRAGFVQGKLQQKTIFWARDNSWNHAYLLDPSHSFPRQLAPTQAELNRAAGLLNSNYDTFLQYLRNPATDTLTAHRLKRLLFRMLGIYHGTSLQKPASLDFSGNWLPDASYLNAAELVLGYQTSSLTFMDIYFLNAYNDMMDVISSSMELAAPGAIDHPDKCSAFLKRSGSEVILTHNTWQGFLSQTMTQTLAVNGERRPV